VGSRDRGGGAAEDGWGSGRGLPAVWWEGYVKEISVWWEGFKKGRNWEGKERVWEGKGSVVGRLWKGNGPGRLE
jgi:hypothetical protein